MTVCTWRIHIDTITYVRVCLFCLVHKTCNTSSSLPSLLDPDVSLKKIIACEKQPLFPVFSHCFLLVFVVSFLACLLLFVFFGKSFSFLLITSRLPLTWSKVHRLLLPEEEELLMALLFLFALQESSRAFSELGRSRKAILTIQHTQLFGPNLHLPPIESTHR